MRQREALQQQRDARTEAQQSSTKTVTSPDVVAGPPLADGFGLGAQPTFSYDPNRHIKIAVILPFNLASTSTAEDKMQMRSVEFYEGLLLAVDELQSEDRHITIQAYDLGTRALEEILTDDSLLTVQAIIAPVDPQQVEQVARYGESHGIPVLSPFAICPQLVDGFPHLYQLTAPKASLYDRLSEALLQQFAHHRIVFVTDSLFQEQKDPYGAYLQQVMDSVGEPYQTYIYNEPYSVMCMDSALCLEGSHVLYILETPQQDALRRFFPSLKNKLFLDANPALAEAIGASYASGDNMVSAAVSIEPEMSDTLTADSLQFESEARKVAILGYPEWQLYTNDFMEYFYDLNVWMFTKFYLNPFELEVQTFYDRFKYWYNRELMQKLYPKYGMLGYDIGRYMVSHLQQTGSLDAMPDEAETIIPLQSAINFEQQGEGCRLNRGLYLVHFTPETTIEKYEIK